jgi:hypothetical protein
MEPVMTDLKRHVLSDAEIAEIGEGVLACTLPKPRWTHAAHFGAAVWLIRTRPDIIPERDMSALIRAYNESTNTPNTDTSGYHETITQASLRGARWHLAHHDGAALHAVLSALMDGPLGKSDWLLTYWSPPVLFSVEARRRWVEPDLAPLPF